MVNKDYLAKVHGHYEEEGFNQVTEYPNHREIYILVPNIHR